MGRYAVLAVICLLMLLLAGASWGYYRYVDAAGTVCFVESLGEVPHRFRSRAVQVDYPPGPPRDLRERPGGAAPPVPEPGGSGEPEDRVPARGGFRWNWAGLVLLVCLGFFAANRVERRGWYAHASRVRMVTLFSVAVLACYYNRDLVSAGMETVSSKVTSMRTKWAEQRERDKKPLKPLSEKVEEMMRQSNP